MRRPREKMMSFATRPRNKTLGFFTATAYRLPSYAELNIFTKQTLPGSASLVNILICRIGQIAEPALSDKGV